MASVRICDMFDHYSMNLCLFIGVRHIDVVMGTYLYLIDEIIP